MPAAFLAHTALLLTSFFGIYFWLTTPIFAAYTLQLVGALILVYAGTHWFRPRRAKRNTSIPLDLTLLTSVILLLVAETGALASPLIFLIYFLLFAVAMLYEIESTLVLTGTLLVFFLLYPGTDLSDLAHLSELIALVMITPIALFTAHQYESILAERARVADLEKHLSHEETDTLIFLSTNLKTTLLSALDSLSLVIPQAKVKEVRHQLEILYQDLKVLYRSSDELQELIDRETDEK
jgi:hypothetical protein